MAEMPSMNFNVVVEDARNSRIEKAVEWLAANRVALIGGSSATEVVAYLSMPYDEPKIYEVRDGVAIVDISGPLAARSYWKMTYADIVGAFRSAMADERVRGILMSINSPGGEVDCAFEAAAEIEQMGKQKPVWCVANTSAYSAGYLLACCADKIYAAPVSGGVGSIGVYCGHVDFSEMLKKEGIKVTLIGDPEGKTAGNPYEPLDEETEREMRADVERLSAEFFSHVARRRKMTVDEVRALNAGTFRGAANAISAKLADRAGTFESALAEMIAATQPKSLFAASAASAEMNSIEGEKVQMNENQNPVTSAGADNPSVPAQAADPTPAAPVVAALPAPAAADLQTVLAMCAIAGLSATDAQQIHGKGMTLHQLQQHLIDRRASADQATNVIGVSRGPANSNSALTDIQRQSAEHAQRNGVTKEQATLAVLSANPKLYDRYLAENPRQTGGLL